MPKMNLRGRVCMRERASYRKENIKKRSFFGMQKEKRI